MTEPKYGSLNEHQITMLLERRFSDHACFRQFRTITGYGDARYIDFVAVGMWGKNWGIKCFEIKVSRQDFFSDVAQFERKHEDALTISNEFYYVCPHLLIDPSEVPKDAGLFSVMKNGTRLRKIKQAPYTKRLAIEMHYFMAFARELGQRIDHTKIPIKYLGRELSQDDFLELVEEEKKEVYNIAVEQKARELNEKLAADNEELRKFRATVKRELTGDDLPWNLATDKELLRRLGEIVSLQALLNNTGKRLADAQKAIEGAFNIVQGIPLYSSKKE